MYQNYQRTFVRLYVICYPIKLSPTCIRRIVTVDKVTDFLRAGDFTQLRRGESVPL
jgi:hypothetical protein